MLTRMQVQPTCTSLLTTCAVLFRRNTGVWCSAPGSLTQPIAAERICSTAPLCCVAALMLCQHGHFSEQPEAHLHEAGPIQLCVTIGQNLQAMTGAKRPAFDRHNSLPCWV